MQALIKIYTLNTIRIAALLMLLIMPVTVGYHFIDTMEIYQISENPDFANVTVVLLIIYFLTIAIFHQKLVGPFQDMILLKYAVVIAVLFWIFYDLYMISQYQAVYFAYQDLIVPRAIVWRDVDILPLYAQYPDAKVGFMLILSALRGMVLIVFASNLMRSKNEVLTKKKTARRKVSGKSIDELKANLHPSIIEKYKNTKIKD